MVRINRFDVLLISLDPTQGAEIKKTRPCVVISPNEMNECMRTIIIAPMTSKVKDTPTRIHMVFDNIKGNIAIDQLRAIDKSRVIKKLGEIDFKTSKLIVQALEIMFQM